MGIWNFILSAQLLQRFRDGRVCVLGQENLSGSTTQDCFFQLFGPDNDFPSFQIGRFAAVRDYTIVFPIHTGIYYTQIYEKVNKNIQKTFAILLKSFVFSDSAILVVG